MIKAIIFDWHGVLDETKLERSLKMTAEFAGITVEEVKAKIRPTERLYTAGKLGREIFWRGAQKMFHLTDEQLEEVRSPLFVVKRIMPLWEKLPELKKHYRLGILSDCSLTKAELIRETVDLSLFDHVYFSAEKQRLKDEPEFFLDLAKALEVTPEETLYIDDNERHIATAKALGFHTCHFRTMEDIENALDEAATGK